jgi:hypothetical protein
VRAQAAVFAGNFEGDDGARNQLDAANQADQQANAGQHADEQDQGTVADHLFCRGLKFMGLS